MEDENGADIAPGVEVVDAFIARDEASPGAVTETEFGASLRQAPTHAVKRKNMDVRGEYTFKAGCGSDNGKTTSPAGSRRLAATTHASLGSW